LIKKKERKKLGKEDLLLQLEKRGGATLEELEKKGSRRVNDEETRKVA